MANGKACENLHSIYGEVFENVKKGCWPWTSIRRSKSSMTYMTHTEEQMTNVMEDIRLNKGYLERHTNQCFKSWSGTFWWPTMVLGGWLGVYRPTCYRILLSLLVGASLFSIQLGFALWVDDAVLANATAVFLACTVVFLVAIRYWYGVEDITWLAEQQKVLVSCVTYHAAHPGIPGFKDATVLLEHVEVWLQKFAHLIDEDEESLHLLLNKKAGVDAMV